jgi:hypothetical protein
VFAASIIRAIALIMEAASTSEESVNLYQTTLRNNPDDIHLHRLRVFETKVLGGMFGPKNKKII